MKFTITYWNVFKLGFFAALGAAGAKGAISLVTDGAPVVYKKVSQAIKDRKDKKAAAQQS